VKQDVSPKVFFVVIAVALVVLIGFIWRTWAGPSASVAPSTGKRQGAARPKLNDAQRKEIEDWKKTHPGAFTQQ
jgi:hypothetical protein